MLPDFRDSDVLRASSCNLTETAGINILKSYHHQQRGQTPSAPLRPHQLDYNVDNAVLYSSPDTQPTHYRFPLLAKHNSSVKRCLFSVKLAAWSGHVRSHPYPFLASPFLFLQVFTHVDSTTHTRPYGVS